MKNQEQNKNDAHYDKMKLMSGRITKEEVAHLQEKYALINLKQNEN
eukprot:CAMPEP_0170506484 /NCGR_PEP_ID=MMETSP0208-20121228/55100_1 /TAXON_ID=197538 /ORGANISM="Strombidium inclinatum, Strain S3" /LENGTH=45 /DNA_ID= /DNA_START= /DNA_END= /DNA_ORIENTATION=